MNLKCGAADIKLWRQGTTTVPLWVNSSSHSYSLKAGHLSGKSTGVINHVHGCIPISCKSFPAVVHCSGTEPSLRFVTPFPVKIMWNLHFSQTSNIFFVVPSSSWTILYKVSSRTSLCQWIYPCCIMFCRLIGSSVVRSLAPPGEVSSARWWCSWDTAWWPMVSVYECVWMGKSSLIGQNTM